MELYLTKEKLVYDGSHDLYISKIGRKRLYCLNDVCRIFGIFFRDTKKNLSDNCNYMVGVMIQRKKRYMENTFIDYDGLIEVLLMSRYDKSVVFKKWLDSIPESSFKKCKKYVRKSICNPCQKSSKPTTAKNEKVEIKNVGVRSVEEPTRSIVIPTSFAKECVNTTSIVSESHTENNKMDISNDMILSICNKEKWSVEMLVVHLDHLCFASKIAYLNNNLIDFDNAVSHLAWIEDLRMALKKKYGSTPYYRYCPSTVLMQEKLSKMK